MRLLIVGGSDAGISAALRAREVDRDVEITVALADAYPNFSICGLPYFLGGETPDWRSLAHRTEFPGIAILRSHVARAIDPSRHTVTFDHDDGGLTLPYDRLIIATGARPILPDLPGNQLPGVFPLHSMDQSFAIQRWISEESPRTAVIIGAGYIGMEMAEALTRQNIKVTVISRSETVLPTVDAALGQIVQQELQRHGVRVITKASATQVIPAAIDRGSRLSVIDSNHAPHPADIVLFAVGVQPNSELAAEAGVRTGFRDAIVVSRNMRTSSEDIFAAGDCVETHHQLMQAPTYLSLGTIAHKQGRVAGENAVGGKRLFPGCLGTQSLRIFDLVVVRAGLLDHEAKAQGFQPVTVATVANDHKAYYPGSVPLTILMTGDVRTGQLLGAQIVGHRSAEISKRIDVVAAALAQRATVDDLNDLDLSYTPPLSSPWDPVQMAAQAWSAQRCRHENE